MHYIFLPSDTPLQLSQTLSDAGHIPKDLTVSATNLQYTAFHTELVIVAEFDGTTDTSIFTALLHNVERRSVHRQASRQQHSVARRAATAGVVNAVTGYVAASKLACGSAAILAQPLSLVNCLSFCP